MQMTVSPKCGRENYDKFRFKLGIVKGVGVDGKFVNPDNSAFQAALNAKFTLPKVVYMIYKSCFGIYRRIYMQQPPTSIWKISHGNILQRRSRGSKQGK